MCSMNIIVALFLSRKLKRDWISIIREMVKYIMVYLYNGWIKKNKIHLYLLSQKYRTHYI